MNIMVGSLPKDRGNTLPQSNELTRGTPAFIGGVHIGARALLDSKFICFAISPTYPSVEEGVIYLLK